MAYSKLEKERRTANQKDLEEVYLPLVAELKSLQLPDLRGMDAQVATATVKRQKYIDGKLAEADRKAKTAVANGFGYAIKDVRETIELLTSRPTARYWNEW